MPNWSTAIAIAFLTLLFAPAARSAEPISGWRGNQTGIWPDANPPIEWQRTPHGALEGLCASADRPKGDGPGEAPMVKKGLVLDWLILGPFAVDNSVKDFDKDCLEGESTIEPAAGQKTAEKTWIAASVPPDDVTVFGTAEMPYLNVGKALDVRSSQLAYAHTYFFSPRGGKAVVVVDHAHGLKAWVNGKQVYRSPDRGMALGYYTAISRHELGHLDQPSPRFEIALKPGWNRLLLKLSTANTKGAAEMRCCLRIMDPPEVQYESKNIRWMTPLPARSTSTPILVGDRLFVLAEPDEILCIDKKSGKVLWTAAVNYYEALSPEERRAKPALAEKVDPLVAKLRAETDRLKRIRLRGEIQKALLAIDAERFKLEANDHFEAHFGIVGFTMPTPLSDGKHVFVWNGTGVAACFDLDGKRQWITRVKTDHLAYGSSPALVDGVLVVFLNALYGLDAKTGKLLWEQKKVRNNVASLLGATFGGKTVVVTQRGDIVRPSDGELLYRPRESIATGDTGWLPPVVLGMRLYQPRYGVASLTVLDFADVGGDEWEPKVIARIGLPQEINKGPGGKWIDRWTAGSPLIWDGLAYEVDIYQWLYVVDLKSGKMLYRRELDLQGLTHYNAVAVAASPTLVGKHIFICDNHGTTIVLEPGREFKMVARNHIGTQLMRTWPIPAQETLCYAPPVADGDCLYFRGEGFLYCVAKK